MFYTVVTEPNLMKRLFLLLALILSISHLSFAQEVTLRVHTIAATGQDSPVELFSSSSGQIPRIRIPRR
jgi:hypothetical protein